MQLRPATTFEDYLIAGHLIHEQYVKSGYISSQSSGVYLNKYHLRKSTAVILAEDAGRILYTLTVVPGKSADALPSFEDFPQEVTQVMQTHTDVAEQTCLAGSYISYRKFNEFCHLVEKICAIRFDCTLICCHPKHEAYYLKQFNARKIAYKESIKRVNSKPGSLLVIDFPNLNQKNLEEQALRGFWDTIYTREIPERLSELVTS